MIHPNHTNTKKKISITTKIYDIYIYMSIYTEYLLISCHTALKGKLLKSGMYLYYGHPNTEAIKHHPYELHVWSVFRGFPLNSLRIYSGWSHRGMSFVQICLIQVALGILRPKIFVYKPIKSILDAQNNRPMMASAGAVKKIEYLLITLLPPQTTTRHG